MSSTSADSGQRVVMMVLLLLVCSSLVCWLPPVVKAQGLVQQTTLRVTQATPNYTPLFASAFAQCPPNTQHIVVLRSVDIPFDNLPVATVNLSIGCCPNASNWGCWDEQDNRLKGCCPTTTVGAPICCYNAAQQMFGCAKYASQCCGAQVCDDTYVCCGDTCCPNLNLAQPNDLESSCLIQNVTDPITNVTTPTVQGCLPAPSLEEVCQFTQIYNVSCAPGSNFTTCPFCAPGQTSCVFPNVTQGYQTQLCLTGGCVRYNVVIQNCTTLLVGCTSGVSYLDFPVGCATNPLHAVCVYTPVGHVPMLVGQLLTGYSCCGPYICAPGMRCCSLDTNTTDVFGRPITTTTYFGCCANVPEIQCCYNNIMDASDPRQVANFFCGAQFNSSACQVDKMRAAAYFALAQLNRNVQTT